MVRPGSIYYPNMDLIRYLLALAVVIAHYTYLTGHEIPFIMSSFEAVGGFFALSGFLVYNGYEKRPSLRRYILSRVKRILPSYISVVVIFWLLLSIVSNLSVWNYFSDITTWKYLIANLCFVNWMQPTLPGIFDEGIFLDNSVNGSLWTMKVEWCLYLSVPLVVLIIRRLIRNRDFVVIAVIISSMIYRLVFLSLFNITGNEIYNILGRQIFGQLSYFYVGVLIFYYRGWLEKNLWLLIVVSGGLMLLSRIDAITQVLVAPFGVSGMVIGISLIKNSPSMLRHNNNLSYLIYLCHWPIIQIGVLCGFSGLSTWLGITIVIVECVLFSWIVSCLIDNIPSFRRSPSTKTMS